jgi:imidazolonepropionase-like amidohydrolase
MMVRKIAATLAFASLTGILAFGQSKPSDRRAFIWPDMPTTDDPRRVPAPPGRTGPEGGIVLKGGSVFDSVKKVAYPATVVIDGNHITAVLPPDSTNWSADAKVIDVTGETVLPGLIDLHVHLTYPDKTTMVDEQASEGNGVLRGLDHLNNLIEHGITSVRDMNGVLNSTYLLSEWMAADRMPGPRVFATGHIITGTGGHAADRPITPIHGSAYAMEADGPVEWRRAVRQNFKDGASWIKIASLFDPEEVKAAVVEAHALGLKVACDCETFYIKWAVEAGVDMIEHPLPRTDETIREMAEHHTEADPTLAVYQTMLDTTGGYYGTASRRFTIGPQQDFDVFKKMKAAGIKMGIGTDTIGEAFHYVPNTYISELKWFVKGGYTPAEALITATKTNAELLDMGDKLGTLEPGKLADILVVQGKPEVDAEDLKKVDKVIKDGYLMVDHGQVQITRHVDTPLPKPSPPDYVH